MNCFEGEIWSIKLDHKCSPSHSRKCFYMCIAIREYSSTLCRDGTEKNGHSYISIASDELRSLIYTDKF